MEATIISKGGSFLKKRTPSWTLKVYNPYYEDTQTGTPSKVRKTKTDAEQIFGASCFAGRDASDLAFWTPADGPAEALPTANGRAG